MRFEKGDDYEGDDMITYGIHVDAHGNCIEVHGNGELRDHILKLLQENSDVRPE